MRARTAGAAALLSTVTLLGAWRAGQLPAEQLPGVRIVSSNPPVAQARSSSPPTETTIIDGGVVSTPYGVVQVRAVFRGGTLKDVKAPRLTDANDTSRSISASAEPVLRREALAAGSAAIDTVSGASYTSEGYRQSLQYALDRAGAR